MSVQDFPAINATLNAGSAVLMIMGFAFIKARRVAAHRACMVGAVVVSSAFLVCYVIYHVQKSEPTRLGATGAIRSVYLAMLLTHVVLAVAIVPLVMRVVYLAARGRFAQHRAWARWTFPVWCYVSVTGVLVYFSLYQWWPAAA